MAHKTLLNLSATAFHGDVDAQLVGGDAAAPPDVPAVGRTVLVFDDTDEAAAITDEMVMPGQYAAGTLKATIEFFTASDVTNDLAMDVFVEAKTPDTDTFDMEASAGWDSANSGTVSVGGTTAGDPRTLTVTLTNKDGVIALDLVRFGVRRDTDSANDDIVGNVYIANVEIWEDT